MEFGVSVEKTTRVTEDVSGEVGCDMASNARIQQAVAGGATPCTSSVLPTIGERCQKDLKTTVVNISETRQFISRPLKSTTFAQTSRVHKPSRTQFGPNRATSFRLPPTYPTWYFNTMEQQANDYVSFPSHYYSWQRNPVLPPFVNTLSDVYQWGPPCYSENWAMYLNKFHPITSAWPQYPHYDPWLNARDGMCLTGYRADAPYLNPAMCSSRPERYFPWYQPLRYTHPYGFRTHGAKQHPSLLHDGTMLNNSTVSDALQSVLNMSSLRSVGRSNRRSSMTQNLASDQQPAVSSTASHDLDDGAVNSSPDKEQSFETLERATKLSLTSPPCSKVQWLFAAAEQAEMAAAAMQTEELAWQQRPEHRFENNRSSLSLLPSNSVRPSSLFNCSRDNRIREPEMCGVYPWGSKKPWSLSYKTNLGTRMQHNAHGTPQDPWLFSHEEHDESLFRQVELLKRKNPRYLQRTRNLYDIHIVLPISVASGKIVVDDPLGANYYAFDAEHEGTQFLFGKGLAPPCSEQKSSSFFSSETSDIASNFMIQNDVMTGCKKEKTLPIGSFPINKDTEMGSPSGKGDTTENDKSIDSHRTVGTTGSSASACDVWASFLHIRLGTLYNLTYNEVVTAVDRFRRSFDPDLCFFHVPVALDCCGIYPSSDEALSQRTARRGYYKDNQDPVRKAERYETHAFASTDNDVKRLLMLCRHVKFFAHHLLYDLKYNRIEPMVPVTLPAAMLAGAHVPPRTWFRVAEYLQPTPCVELHNNARATTISDNYLKIIIREWSPLLNQDMFRNVWKGSFSLRAAPLTSATEHPEQRSEFLQKRKDIFPVCRIELGEIRLEHNHLRMVDPRWPSEWVLGRRIADRRPEQDIPDAPESQARYIFCPRVQQPSVVYEYSGSGDPRLDALSSRLGFLFRASEEQRKQTKHLSLSSAALGNDDVNDTVVSVPPTQDSEVLLNAATSEKEKFWVASSVESHITTTGTDSRSSVSTEGGTCGRYSNDTTPINDLRRGTRNVLSSSENPLIFSALQDGHSSTSEEKPSECSITCSKTSANDISASKVCDQSTMPLSSTLLPTAAVATAAAVAVPPELKPPKSERLSSFDLVHHLSALRPEMLYAVPRISVACKYFLNGGCAREQDCQFLHPLDPSLECKVDAVVDIGLRQIKQRPQRALIYAYSVCPISGQSVKLNADVCLLRMEWETVRAPI